MPQSTEHNQRLGALVEFEKVQELTRQSCARCPDDINAVCYLRWLDVGTKLIHNLF